MKNPLKLFAIFAITALFFSGCEKEDPIIHVSSLSLDKSSLSLVEGDSGSLTVTVNPSDATDKRVTWSSSNESVATVSGGSIMAITPGTTTVTVTSEDGGKTASCSITVVEKVIPVESVELDNSTLSIPLGESKTLIATVLPDDATNQNIEWSSSNIEVATVDNDGKITTLKGGETTITVTTEDGAKSAESLVTVVDSKIYAVVMTEIGERQSDVVAVVRNFVEGLTLAKATSLVRSSPPVVLIEESPFIDAEAFVEELIAAGATAYYMEALFNNHLILTNTGDTKVEVIKAIRSFTDLDLGEAKALVDFDPPTVIVRDQLLPVAERYLAEIEAAGATAHITTQFEPATSLSLNKSNLTLTVGEYDRERLVTTVSPTGATDRFVYWSSSNSSVATVNATGLIIAASPGTTTITATTRDGNHSATCLVTVTDGKSYAVVMTKIGGRESDVVAVVRNYVDGLTLTEATSLVNSSSIVVLKRESTILDAEAFVEDLEMVGATAYYTEALFNNHLILTKSPKAVDVQVIKIIRDITPLTLAAAKSLIRIVPTLVEKELLLPVAESWLEKLNAISGVEAEITTQIEPVKGIVLNKSSLTLKLGGYDSETLVPTLLPAGATDKLIYWSSSKSGVASVTGDDAPLIRAYSPGKAIITFTTRDGSYSATCEVTVEPAD